MLRDAEVEEETYKGLVNFNDHPHRYHRCAVKNTCPFLSLKKTFMGRGIRVSDTQLTQKKIK